MTKETNPMTPSQLLEGYDYAVVRFGYDNLPLVSDLFSLESSATECALGMNTCIDDPNDEYSVVRILHTAKAENEPAPQFSRELDEALTSVFNLNTAIDLTIMHIVGQCERLCDKNMGKRFKDMDRSQLVSYECDRATYDGLANVLAFMRGVTYPMNGVDIPDVPAFPNPEI